MRLRRLAEDPVAGTSVVTGVEHLQALFGRRGAKGVDLAVQALATAMPEESVRALATAYLAGLTEAYHTA